MNTELFLQRLYELKNFIKQNPSQKIIYSDIPIDFLIMQTKKKIYEKENDAYVQDRPDNDDFVTAVGVPF